MTRKSTGNQEAYRQICAQNNDLPVFLRCWWLDVVCPDWDVAIVYNGDMLSGVWPYPVEQKLGVRLVRTPLLTPYLGPHVFFPPDLRDSRRDSFEHDTIAALLKLITIAPVWHLALPPGLRQAGLLQASNLVLLARQTFLIDLNKTESDLLSDMKDTLRKNIRQAGKEITITPNPPAVDTLYEWHKVTLEKKGKKVAHNLVLMQQLMAACVANNCGMLWVAASGDDLQAMVWQVWDANRSYYIMGAQKTETGGHKAISALLWHCMQEAKKRNISTFDLEGSMDQGVERFFRSFGGRRELYLTAVKNNSKTWKLKEQIFG